MIDPKKMPKITKSETPIDNLGPCNRCHQAPGKYEWHHEDGTTENLCLTCCHQSAAKEWGVVRRRIY